MWCKRESAVTVHGFLQQQSYMQTFTRNALLVCIASPEMGGLSLSGCVDAPCSCCHPVLLLLLCACVYPQECDPAELDIEHIPEQEEGEGPVIQMVSRVAGGAHALLLLGQQHARKEGPV